MNKKIKIHTSCWHCKAAIQCFHVDLTGHTVFAAWSYENTTAIFARHPQDGYKTVVQICKKVARQSWEYANFSCGRLTTCKILQDSRTNALLCVRSLAPNMDVYPNANIHHVFVRNRQLTCEPQNSLWQCACQKSSLRCCDSPVTLRICMEVLRVPYNTPRFSPKCRS